MAAVSAPSKTNAEREGDAVADFLLALNARVVLSPEAVAALGVAYIHAKLAGTA